MQTRMIPSEYASAKIGSTHAFVRESIEEPLGALSISGAQNGREPG